MRLELMAQRRSHPGKEFIHAERFGHIIVSAKIKGLHLAGLITTARKHNHRDSFVSPSDHPKKLMPWYIWKAEIENDDVGRLSKKFECVFAVGCVYDMITMRA